jgi:flavodoxin
MAHDPTFGRRDALKAALAAGAIAAAPRMAFAQEAEGPRLVVYLSRSGNTRVIAGALARRFGADVFELRPREPWPEDYDEMVAWASRLRESAADVPLAESLGELGRYRTVFLGFPVWGTDLPAVTRSFLRSHDLSGKTVVPFITYGSSGEGSSMRTVRALVPEARLVEPFVLRCDQERSTLDSLNAWLDGVGETL